MNKAQRLLDEIARDHVSGASILASKGAEFFLAYLDERKTAPPVRLAENIEELGNRLIAAQPGMAQIYSLVNSLNLRISKTLKEKPSSKELVRVIRSHITNFIKDSHLAVREIATIAGALIEDGYTVFTHSYSSSVYAGLKQAKAADRRFRIIVTESRPMYEGRNLAKELSALGLPVSIITDSSMTPFVAESNLVLLGADIVTEAFIVNKVGSFPISLLADRFEIPMYAVSELTKCMRAKLVRDFKVERPQKEVWAKYPKGIDIKNVYYEAVPLELFKGVVTEQGIMTAEDISEYVLQ